MRSADLAMLASNFSSQCDRFGHRVIINIRKKTFEKKKYKKSKKKLAAFALYQKVAFGIHFIISFQYFINILVITVKAGCVFFFIYEGTLRRCFF